MDLLRRILLSAAMPAMLSCIGGPAVTEPPKLIHGGWVRFAMDEAGPDAVPESVRGLRVEKVWKATYKGPQDISGVWILFPGETVAFEAFQRFAKNPAQRPFFRGAFLVVLNAEGVPPQALGDFQEGVAKAIH
jgi:hypothetical protein